ncbi:MAG TPA: A/G-specific adenine glycosylase [Candidatus Limnocylindria bacterium]|jgi:A/G-specific adenine glycosylase|nr:A/G-specific adenine glycosylase [Candidatus Limnocylindria bacterium]
MPASADDLRHVRARVLRWYDAEKRDLPWRRTRDPYPVLVSEVMLQQTQASRVIGRFSRFLARFPSVEALAAATTAEVLAEWSGLGYNRRALALQRAAAEVVRAGGWPRDVEGLRRLPGIGPYTARALASLAFGQPVGAVDTNVRRWLVRRFAVADAPPAIQQLADALASTGADGRADAWTNASIEFGAVVCRARSPRCDACPIRTGCPSRGAGVTVPVPRQAPLAGSDREVRGAVLRHLAGAEGHASAERTLRAALARELVAEVDTDRWERVLSALERDGLAHRQAGSLRLGAATIDP